jgi:hypothetical protein
MFSKAPQPQQAQSAKSTTSFFKPEPTFKSLANEQQATSERAPESVMRSPMQTVQRKSETITPTSNKPSNFKPQTSNFPIQAKLTVGQPNDKYEQEADAMADKVIQRWAMPNAVAAMPTITPFNINAAQRACAACEKEDKDHIQRKESGEMTASLSVESRLSATKGGGSSLPESTRTQMESSIGADFSNVRVHTGGEAVQLSQDLSAHAFTHGSDVYFNSGKFAPDTEGGRHLLAHELVHTVQQGSETVRRFEKPDNTPDAELNNQDWKISDRVTTSARWQRANIFNLNAGMSHEYVQPHERADFYLWFYNYTSLIGYQTRWPLAAYLVARGAASLSYGTPFENDVQVVARQGNQIIFDDVFPKLRNLLTRGVLTGVAAQNWDAQVLSNEQQLVESMYGSMSPATITRFESYAKQKGFLATAGGYAGFTHPQRSGSFHRSVAMPVFTGNIRNIDDRFNYGMQIADTYSTHPAPSVPITRPAADPNYILGAAFTSLNNRINLHRLDAELDDFNVNEANVISITQSLTTDEQRELGFNRRRLDFMKSALDSTEMQQALNGKTSIDATTINYLTN